MKLRNLRLALSTGTALALLAAALAPGCGGSTTKKVGVYLMNNSYDSALATATTPRVHVYAIGTMTPGTPILDAISYRVNGAAQTLTRNGGGLGNGNFEDFSGANFSLIGNLESGAPEAFIAEALVYDRALSSTESASVEQALETRYGIH